MEPNYKIYGGMLAMLFVASGAVAIVTLTINNMNVPEVVPQRFVSVELMRTEGDSTAAIGDQLDGVEDFFGSDQFVAGELDAGGFAAGVLSAKEGSDSLKP